MTVITDNFNRADGSIGTSSEGWSWTAVDGVWNISSNRVTQTTINANDTARAESDLATSNHYAQITITTYGGGTNLNNGGPCTRFSSSAKTCYTFVWRSASGGQFQLFKVITGTYTQLGTGGSTKADGDVLTLASNSSNQHIGYRNGVINMTAVTDTSITTNTRTGMEMNPLAANVAFFDNFSAGDLQLIPFPWMNTTGNMQDMTGGMRM